jgi:hypothetical protein
MDWDHIHQQNQKGKHVCLYLFVLIKHYRLAFSGNKQAGYGSVPHSGFVFKDSISEPVLEEVIGLPRIHSVRVAVDEVLVVIRRVVKLRWDRLVDVVVPVHIVQLKVVVCFSRGPFCIRDCRAKLGSIISLAVLRVIDIVLDVLLRLEKQAIHRQKEACLLSPLVLFNKSG